MTPPNDQYDYMDRDDFEELLADKPRDEKWELIGGRVVRMMVGARWKHNFIIQTHPRAYRVDFEPLRPLVEP